MTVTDKNTVFCYITKKNHISIDTLTGVHCQGSQLRTANAASDVTIFSSETPSKEKEDSFSSDPSVTHDNTRSGVCWSFRHLSSASFSVNVTTFQASSWPGSTFLSPPSVYFSVLSFSGVIQPHCTFLRGEITREVGG